MILNDIVTAVRHKLADRAGLPVYSEDSEACAVQPCFFVRLTDSEIENALNDRLYLVSADINVVFIPEDDEKEVNSMFADASHMLFFSLNYIEVSSQAGTGQMIRGRNMEAQRAEGDVLSFSVTYEFYARLISGDDAGILMERLEFEVSEKK